jgi:hypothetical protein
VLNTGGHAVIGSDANRTLSNAVVGSDAGRMLNNAVVGSDASRTLKNIGGNKNISDNTSISGNTNINRNANINDNPAQLPARASEELTNRRSTQGKSSPSNPEVMRVVNRTKSGQVTVEEVSVRSSVVMRMNAN